MENHYKKIQGLEAQEQQTMMLARISHDVKIWISHDVKICISHDVKIWISHDVKNLGLS